MTTATPTHNDRPSAATRSGGPTQRILRLADALTCPLANRLGWGIVGLLTLIFLGQLFSGVIPQDEGTLLTYPWLIAQGAVPYRDVRMMYPPTTFVILAAMVKVGIPGLVADRGIGIAARLAYIILVNRALSGSWRRFSWLGVLTTSTLLFFASTDMRAYPWIVGMPVLFLGLLTMRDRPALSGGAFVMAGTIRFEYGLVGVIALTLLAGFHLLRKEPWRRELGSAAAVVLVSALLYLILNALTAGHAIRDIFLDPLFVIGPASRTPVPLLAFGPVGVPIELAMVAGPLIVAALALRAGAVYEAAVSLALLPLLSNYWNTPDIAHLFSVSAILVPWTLIGLTRLLRHTAEGTFESSRPPSPYTAAVQRTAGVAMALIGAVCTVWYSLLLLAYVIYLSPLSPRSSLFFLDASSRLVPVGTHTILTPTAVEARDDQQVVGYVRSHGDPRMTVFVTPLNLNAGYTATDLYYALRLRPVSRYLEMEAGIINTTAQSQIIHRLNACSWVVLLRGGQWYSAAAGGRPSNAPLDRFIQARYRPVKANYTYEILRSRDPCQGGSGSAG